MRRVGLVLLLIGMLGVTVIVGSNTNIALASGGVASPTPATTLSSVWFHEDFTTRANRWRLVDLDKASVAYDDATLAMKATPADYALWSVPDTDLKLDRYNIEVDALFGKTNTDARIGVIIGYRSESDMLVLAVNRTGNVYLGKYYFGVWSDVIPPVKVKIDPTKAVTLRAASDGSHTLRIYVNSQLAGKTILKDFRASSFGLFALSGKRGGVDVAFSRFVVSDFQ